MKTMNYLLIPLILVFLSCGGGDKQKKTDDGTNDKEISAPAKADNKDISDCDSFLDAYEKWVDEYLDVVEIYMKNPADATMAQKYTQIMQDAATWVSKWANMSTCVVSKKHAKRFEEISLKISKKSEELGIKK